jgi:hypothetical protein
VRWMKMWKISICDGADEREAGSFYGSSEVARSLCYQNERYRDQIFSLTSNLSRWRCDAFNVSRSPPPGDAILSPLCASFIWCASQTPTGFLGVRGVCGAGSCAIVWV